MQMKKPAKPYAVKRDGSSYVMLSGGPMNKMWMRNYPPMQPEYRSMGAIYRLIPNAVIDPAYPEDRQVGFTFVGYEEGME